MHDILEIDRISKTYKNGRGITDISLNVQKGDIYGLLGPNGAGKTTVMKLITGLLRPDRGQVKIFGHRVETEGELALAKVGCLIETASAYDFLPAAKNLEMAARFYPYLDKARVGEVLELVGLTKYAGEKVAGYSLGMKQRLGLALALISQPELVILDEPVNGLDIEGMVDMRNTISLLAKETGITFLISSHLIHEVELLCNRIGIITDGRLQGESVVGEVLEQGYESLEAYYIETIKGLKGGRNDETALC